MGISSATIEFIVHKQLPLLLLPSLQLWESGTINKLSICRLLLEVPRSSSSRLSSSSCFPASLSPPRVQFLGLSLGFCSVIWNLQRVSLRASSPFWASEAYHARTGEATLPRYPRLRLLSRVYLSRYLPNGELSRRLATCRLVLLSS